MSLITDHLDMAVPAARSEDLVKINGGWNGKEDRSWAEARAVMLA